MNFEGKIKATQLADGTIQIHETILTPDDIIVVPPPDDNKVLMDLVVDGTFRNDYKSHVIEGSNFNRRSVGRYQSINNQSSNSVACRVGRASFPIQFLAPVIATDVLITGVLESEGNGHSQLRAVSDELDQKTLTKKEKTYRFETVITAHKQDVRDVSWILPIQGHPNVFGPEWDDPSSRQPVLALYLKKGEYWEFFARGSDESLPNKYTHTYRSERIPFKGGTQRIAIEFRADPMSGKSFAKCYLNDQLIGSAENQPVGINWGPAGHGESALNLSVGYYGPKQWRPISIVSMRLSEIKKPVITPPPSGGFPQLEVMDNKDGKNSFDHPILEGNRNQIRGWFYPSVVYANSKFHFYGPVDTGGNLRSLHRAVGGMRSVQEDVKHHVRDHIEQVNVWKEGPVFYMSGIRKHEDPRKGTFHHFTGKSFNRGADWAFSEAPKPHTGGFATGDIHTVVPKPDSDGKFDIWIKGHDFRYDNPSDPKKPTDYFRPWFHNGTEIRGLTDIKPDDGLRYDVYSMSIIRPRDHEWESKTQYVALIGLFKITDPAPTPGQHGPIDLVWAVSDDGVNWDLPWKDRHAVDKSKAIMVNPGMNMLPWGNQLLCYSGVAHFSHNDFNKDRSKTTGMGLCVMDKSDFENSFR